MSKTVSGFTESIVESPDDAVYWSVLILSLSGIMALPALTAGLGWGINRT